MSESAYDKHLSNVLPLVDRYHPAIAANPEIVLRASPDLVLAPASSRPDGPALLRQAGLTVYRMPTLFATLAQVDAHIRLVGYLTGEDGRAAVAARRFERAIDRAAHRRPADVPPPRVLGLGGRYSYGSDTLFNDVLRVLGARNVAAEHGMRSYNAVGDEQIVRWDPDWIVTSADPAEIGATRAALLRDPAVAATRAGREGHVVVLESRVFRPLSPFVSLLLDALGDAMYGPAR